MSWLQEPFDFHYFQISSVSLSLKTKTKKNYRHFFLFLLRAAEPLNEIWPWKLPEREVCGGGGMDIRGEGGDTIGAR